MFSSNNKKMNWVKENGVFDSSKCEFTIYFPFSSFPHSHFKFVFVFEIYSFFLLFQICSFFFSENRFENPTSIEGF